MLPYMNLTGDEDVDGAMRLSAEGGEGVYKLVKFIRNHKGEKDNELVREALSLYRGGAYNPEHTAELNELITQLSGGSCCRQFVFLGNNSDLSYFWRRDEAGENASLSLAELNAAVPDAALRQKTAMTMARCYVDGLLDYDAAMQTYTLTPRGEKYVYSGEFINERMLKEAAFFTRAEMEAKAAVADERMTERGFSGCVRVTVDRESLKAEESAEGLFCRVPGTKGSEYMRFAPGTYFPRGEKTFEVYIKPESRYTVLNADGEAQKEVGGSELSKHYDIKNRAAERFAAKLRAAEPVEGASYQTGEYVFAVDVYNEGYALNQYRVEYVVPDKQSGEAMYKLSPTASGRPEMIQSESCVGKTIFPNRNEGRRVLASKEGQAAADAVKASFKKTADAITAAVPKLDIYTAAAGAVSQTAGKAVHALTR